MGLFDSKDEKERELKYKEAVKQIIAFPGSLAEYERLKSYDVEIIDTQKRDKGVMLCLGEERIVIGRHNEFRDYLIDQGIEAIVNAVAFVNPGVDAVINTTIHYGLPVRKKVQK